MKNWVADVSATKAQESEADQKWSDEYFIKALATLGLDTFVLVTAPSEGGGASEIEEWTEGAQRKMGGSLAMFHVTSMDQVRTIIHDRASSPARQAHVFHKPWLANVYATYSQTLAFSSTSGRCGEITPNRCPLGS